MKFDALVDVLKELIRQPSVVGAEHSFFRALQRALEERGARVTWYDGLLVATGEEPETFRLSAHVDRHGLVCTGPNEFQYAAFVAGERSDLLGNSVSEQLMHRVAGRFEAAPVQAYEPWSGAYRGAGVVTRSSICEYRNNLVFEVAGLEHLVAGTPVAFTDRLRVEDGRFIAQLDNVLTNALLVHLFELGYRGTAFFTAQEESGRSWRYLLEWFRRFGRSHRELIVLDTSPYPESSAADAQDVVLRHRDANAEFSREATDRLVETCRALGVRWSFKDAWIRERSQRGIDPAGPPPSLGSTELGRIVRASEGWVQGTTLQVPTTGYHTMNESASIGSCEAFLRVLLAVTGTS